MDHFTVGIWTGIDSLETERMVNTLVDSLVNTLVGNLLTLVRYISYRCNSNLADSSGTYDLHLSSLFRLHCNFLSETRKI